MKKQIQRNLMKYTRILTAAGLITALAGAPALTALAHPIVAGAGETPIDDVSEIDDAEALENAHTDEVKSGVADGKTAAHYLLDNSEKSVIKQIPTDEHDSSLPEKFDLRDLGVVTPVKDQSPYGTCWGFADIAASETSILSAMGKTYAETGLDLSEHHLTYFTRSHLEDDSSQNGEGVYMFDDADTFNTGGMQFNGASIFSCGIGPVTEELIPYRGLNSNTERDLWTNMNYSSEDDWSLPDDYKFVQSYQLTDSSRLPSAAVYESDLDVENEEDIDVRDEAYLGYDAAATDEWKRALLSGHALSIGFAADTATPDSVAYGDVPFYLNTSDNKWTHYTFESAPANHSVTVVGWDDTIPRTDFMDHTNDEYGDGEAHQPEGDGAWIVKNSWGAETESFPNHYKWGIENENGEATGYFYISYYDRSLDYAETFDFDIDTENNPAYIVDQYDYLPAEVETGWAAEEGLQMANVFTAEADSEINAVSCETNVENTSVTYQICLLGDDAETPDDGELAAVHNEDYPHAGFHRADLDQPVPVKKGQKYAVIVTSCFKSDDQLYYEFSTSMSMNQEAAEEYNRKIHYRNRNKEEEEYKEELLMYYTKGIVNPGESYIYMDELGQWGDFAEIIPYLQDTEDFEGSDFDNFPVKAYLTFANADEAAAAAGESMNTELTFSDPAGPVNYLYIAKIAVLVLLIILMFVIEIRARLKRRKKLKRLKELERQIPILQNRIAELEKKAGEEKEENENS